MIAARLINSDATINNFRQIGSISFLNGAPFNINLQFYNTELGNRVVFDPALVVRIIVQSLDGTAIGAITGTPLSGTVNSATITDTSIYSFDISTTINPQTSIGLAGGNIEFEVRNTSDVLFNRGVLFNALAREIIDGSC